MSAVSAGNVLRGLCLALGAGLVFVLAWALKPDERTPPLPEAAAPAPEPLRQREPTPIELLNVASSVSAAAEILRPHFRDTTDDTDEWAVALAHWSSARLTWTDLHRLPDVKFGAALKDPLLARGKRHCNSGSLVEIEIQRGAGVAPMYFGGLFSDSGQVVRFIAVHSTGELIQGSPARICGVVTGLHSYANSGGGTTRAVHIVGMFDLPENRTRQ
jgi:hypothetical protein